MVRWLIDWSLANPLIVMLAAAAMAVGGGYAFTHVNIEAYPDPAPAIIEVVAQYPGASAEEVERQVTIPLEVALAGMQGLETRRSKSLFGLSHIRNQFDYSRDYEQAKQDVMNRLKAADSTARADFDKSYAQYKDITKQMFDLRDRYPVATEAERPAMEK